MFGYVNLEGSLPQMAKVRQSTLPREVHQVLGQVGPNKIENLAKFLEISMQDEFKDSKNKLQNISGERIRIASSELLQSAIREIGVLNQSDPTQAQYDALKGVFDISKINLQKRSDSKFKVHKKGSADLSKEYSRAILNTMTVLQTKLEAREIIAREKENAKLDEKLSSTVSDLMFEMLRKKGL